MKKIFFIAILFVTVFMQPGFAQLVTSPQEESTKLQPSPILASYYDLKDALVRSNADEAAESAVELSKAINATDKETIKDESRNALLSDADAISKTKDIKVQREKFATLSANMAALAKTVKLSSDPVYLQYCPMKKASWLSDNKAIKNPYYGSAMLTCGSVKETF